MEHSSPLRVCTTFICDKKVLCRSEKRTTYKLLRWPFFLASKSLSDRPQSTLVTCSRATRRLIPLCGATKSTLVRSMLRTPHHRASREIHHFYCLFSQILQISFKNLPHQNRQDFPFSCLSTLSTSVKSLFLKALLGTQNKCLTVF